MRSNTNDGRVGGDIRTKTNYGNKFVSKELMPSTSILFDIKSNCIENTPAH